MRCSKCGRDNRAQASFCDGCGAPVAAGTPSVGEEVFIGREHELADLAGVLSEAAAGRGGVVMLCGDPGIGKTRTAQILAGLADDHGMAALWGRCHEAAGAPPYWPWLQTLRSWIDRHDDEALQRTMDASASCIAEIAPEIARRLPALAPPAPAADAEQARFRLFDAVGTFWKRAAAQQPLLLVLDDLHWADTSSLRLLEFVAQDVAASPIVVLGTYRDIALTRRHPLSDTLGQLARCRRFQRLRLAGLDLVETSQLMAGIAGRPLSGELVTRVHGQTEGNPLFLLEMTRFLAQEGALGSPRPGIGIGAEREPRLQRIPEGVHEVIGTRLNHLSIACNRVLGNAAIIGRRFALDLLAGLLDDLLEEQCLAAVEEALAARVIEELPEPGWYQFSHALIRETLYEEMPALRRRRLHQRIGATLEALYRDDPAPWLSLLAHHHCAALPDGDAAKAADYARRAADQADAMLAYEEAARYRELALQALDPRAAGVAGQRCELRLALGEAQTKAGENLQALQNFRLAAADAKALGATQQLVRAALGFEGASWRPGLPGDEAVAMLDEALQALPAGDGIERARVLGSMCRALGFTKDLARSEQVGEEAVAMARRLGDATTLSRALNTSLWAWRPWRTDFCRRAALAREAYVLACGVGHKTRILQAATTYLLFAMTLAEFRTWRSEFDTCARLAEEVRQPFYRLWWRSARAALALCEGRFEEGERLMREALELGRRVHGLEADGVYSLQRFNLERERGGLRPLAPLVRQFVETTPKASTWHPALALVYCELGMKDEARAVFETLATDNFAGIPRDSFWNTCIVYLVEVCAFLGDAPRAAILYRLLAPHDGCTVVVGASVALYGAVARFLGLLAATQGDWPLAERHFADALAINTRMGARACVAHTRGDYAAMLVARDQPGDRERALGLAEEALAASRAFGMRALDERMQALLRENAAQAAVQAAPIRYPGGLSRREVEVLQLVAVGKGNREIAERLFLSENTVANHVRSILGKTGTANRTEAAAFAAQNGLLSP